MVEQIKVGAHLGYLVTFYFMNMECLTSIEAVLGDDRHSLGIPTNWSQEKSGHDWITFEADEPIKKKDVANVRRHFQKLDDAFTAIKRQEKRENNNG